MRQLIALGVGLSAIVAVSCSGGSASVGEAFAFDVDAAATAVSSSSQPTRVDIEATITAAVEATQAAVSETAAPTATPSPAPTAVPATPPVTYPAPLSAPTATPPAGPPPVIAATPAPTPTTTSAAFSAPTENSVAIESPTPASTPVPESRAEMIERVRGAVVRINTDVASGSGAIVEVDDSSGAAYVLTGYRLVEGDSQIDVTVNDRDVFQASIVGFDARRDLSVLRICCGTDFTHLTFADPNAVRLKDHVLAFGYPAENASNSARVAEGTVSGLVYDFALDRREIQTDAAIDSEVNGGPLVLDTGAIAGINAFVVISTPGPGPVFESGFAISTDDLEGRYDAMRSGESAASPAPTPDLRFPNGVYTNPASGWQINVPGGWRLDESDTSRVDVWDGSNQATVRVSLISVDPVLYPDALFFRQQWTVSPAPDWSNYKIVSESIDIFRTKISNSRTVRGHEFRATFTFDDRDWLETTHWFVTDGTRYAVTLLAPADVQTLPENSAFDVDLRITFTSFRPL